VLVRVRVCVCITYPVW